MKKYLLQSLTLAFTLWICNASAQSSPDALKTLLSRIDTAHSRLPREKVHLHFDKPYYTIGDTIWFKAYVVNAEANEFSALSKILYVDLIDGQDSVRRSLRLPLSVGTAAANIVLTDTLSEGNYRVRAYTQWMRNFSPELFFDKTIPVGNSLSNSMVTNVSYTFLPDGDKQTLTATIFYTTLDGSVYAGKEVSWQAMLDGRAGPRGRGVTDAAGKLLISFSDKLAALQSGSIIASLMVDPKDKAGVVKNIPIKYTSSAAADVQFFAEGGSLVEGIPSKVGFKAVGGDGLGAHISGSIVDKDNNKVLDFKSARAGMGSFPFVWAAGNSYKAVVAFADGSGKSFDLPKAAPAGYVLSVDNSAADNVRVRIFVSPAILKDGAEVTLVALSGGVVSYVAKTRLASPLLSTQISKKRFPTGVVQFTLFAGPGLPVAERLVFVNNEDQSILAVSTDKPSYNPRQKVNMSIAVTDSGKAAQGSFSLAVTNMNKVAIDEESETTILSNLLLTSDLKGYIEKPNYYFINPAAKAVELDNLMLTQGWRRFDWKAILADQVPVATFAAEKGITVGGRVLAGNKPVEKGKVTLFINASGIVLDTLTDAEGHFSFNNLIFADTARIVIQARDAKNKTDVKIELEKGARQAVTENPNRAALLVNVNSALLPYLKDSKQQFDEMEKYGLLKKSGIQLKEVEITTKKTGFEGKEVIQNSTNLNNAGHYDYQFSGEKLKGFGRVEDALSGKLGNIRIVPGKYGEAYAIGRQARADAAVPMAVWINGMDMGTDLNQVSVSNIASIEVLKGGVNTAMYGQSGNNGVIVINLKKGDEKFIPAEHDAPGVQALTMVGYTIGKDFYSPVYAPSAAKTIADLRTTIYWNPDILPDKDGKASVDFFTADTPGTYRVITEGMDYAGKPARTIFTYTVK